MCIDVVSLLRVPGMPLIRHTCMKGDMALYTSGACQMVRSSAWKPKGVNVLL